MSLIIFTKNSILDVWLGTEYAFGSGVWDINNKEPKNENEDNIFSIAQI